MRIAIIVGIFVAQVCCYSSQESASQDALDQRRWQGLATFSFEDITFVESGGTERWALHATPQHTLRYSVLEAAARAAMSEKCGPDMTAVSCSYGVDIDVDGVLSAPGRFGHFGALSRQLDVKVVHRAEPSPL